MRLSTFSLALAVGMAAVLIMVAGESLTALSIAILDGGVTLLALAAAGLAGGWLLRLLGLSSLPWYERLIVGAALGVGALSLLTLGLGSAGYLQRSLWIVLLLLLAVAGIVRLALDVKAEQGTKWAESTATAETAPGRWHWLWLLACPFLAITILAACLPPGILWKEEGFGYDVLEYHLAVPKMFFDQGGIVFLSNNVYSNFPLNSEMLSLLMMVLRGDAVEAAFMAQMVNVFLSLLLAASAWLAAGTFSPRAGLVAAIAALTAPWTAYLAGIAYVEIGMLAMGMASVAVAIRAGASDDRLVRRGLLAGLLVGLSAGFKYTALPMIACPVGLFLACCRRPWRERAAGLAGFVLGVFVTFSPWMLRNACNTGNPVFPLAYSVFGAKPGAWDSDLEARWQKAHGWQGIAEDDEPAVLRLATRTLGDFRIGPILVVLALAGALWNRDRWTLVLLAILAWQTAIWLAATHQYARFAVVMLLPLMILVGRAFEPSDAARPLLVVLLIAGTMWNLYRLGRLYYDHTRVKTASGVVSIEAYGHTDWFADGQWPGTRPIGAVNERPPGTLVMLVGEARTFYVSPPCDYATVFNHHPLADAVRETPEPGAVLAWLNGRGYRYILVNWLEMDRLRRTYGFHAEIDRSLFERLVTAGLTVKEEFRLPPNEGLHATLYEVPGK